MVVMEKDYSYIKRIIIQTIGVFLLGAGIAFNNASLFGTDPMSVFLVGGAFAFGTTMGIVNIFVCLIEIALGYYVDKKIVSIGTFISMIAGSLGIDVVASLLPSDPSMPVRIIFVICGIIMYTFGTALSQYPKCGYMTYDCLIIGLTTIFKIEDYHTIRWVTDIGFMIVGWLLGGKVGLCTIFLMFTAGKLVEFFLSQMNKHFGEVKGA